jgi:hypothetical protein
MRYVFAATLLLTLMLPGCGPKLSKTELGTVVFEVPQVTGADKPYEMPELNQPIVGGQQ